MKEKEIKRYVLIVLLFFLSLSVSSCPPPETGPHLNFNERLLLDLAFQIDNGKINLMENSTVTIAWIDSIPFYCNGGTVYSSTTSTDSAHYITITINNPQVQIYNETSSDIDIQYCNGAPFFRVVPTRPFTLEITRWDSRAVGTFSGTLEHRFDNASTVSITDGSFDILIQ